MIDRRRLVVGAAALLTLAAFPAQAKKGKGMYGLIGKFRARAGQREALIAILPGDGGSLPGCLSYVVARDANEADIIWVTEVWDSQESHAASLSLPEVKEAIAAAMPLIAAMDSIAETEPVGGIGI